MNRNRLVEGSSIRLASIYSRQGTSQAILMQQLQDLSPVISEKRSHF